MRECLLINKAENMALVPLSRSRLHAGPENVDEAAQVLLNGKRHLLLRAQKNLEKHVALDAAEEHSCHDFVLVPTHPTGANLALDIGRNRPERAQRRRARRQDVLGQADLLSRPELHHDERHHAAEEAHRLQPDLEQRLLGLVFIPRRDERADELGIVEVDGHGRLEQLGLGGEALEDRSFGDAGALGGGGGDAELEEDGAGGVEDSFLRDGGWSRHGSLVSEYLLINPGRCGCQALVLRLAAWMPTGRRCVRPTSRSIVRSRRSTWRPWSGCGCATKAPAACTRAGRCAPAGTRCAPRGRRFSRTRRRCASTSPTSASTCAGRWPGWCASSASARRGRRATRWSAR